MPSPNPDDRATQVLAAIVESAVDAIIVIDARGQIETFNPAAERLFGYREAEVIGRNVNMLMPSPYREEHDGYLANYLRTGVAKILGREREVEGQRKDGTKFPLALRVTEMRHAGDIIDDLGKADTHTLQINWSDGTTETIAANAKRTTAARSKRIAARRSGEKWSMPIVMKMKARPQRRPRSPRSA